MYIMNYNTAYYVQRVGANYVPISQIILYNIKGDFFFKTQNTDFFSQFLCFG